MQDCPLGAQRRHFWLWVAPAVALLLLPVTVAIGLADRAHVAWDDVRPVTTGAPSVVDAPPRPRLEPQTNARPAPPARGPFMSTTNASTVVIDQAFVSFVSSRTNATLTRVGVQFTFALDCSVFSTSLHRTGTLDANVVDAFLAAVGAHQLDPSAPTTTCAHTDDYPNILVTVTTQASSSVNLRVTNCSRQWSADGIVLSADPPPPERSFFEIEHPSINSAYRAILDAIGTRRCFDDVKAIPRGMVCKRVDGIVVPACNEGDALCSCAYGTLPAPTTPVVPDTANPLRRICKLEDGTVVPSCMKGDPFCSCSGPPETKVTDAGPTSTPTGPFDPSFDRSAAARALAGVSVQACKRPDGPTGSGHVEVVFAPDGSVQSAAADTPPFSGTPTGACIAEKYRGARIQPFAGAPVKVGKSFVVH